MIKLRPHHKICIKRLSVAISIFGTNEAKYFELIRMELERRNFLRKELLDPCKYTWGIIYNKDIMNRLYVAIQLQPEFIGCECDSICELCQGKTEDNKCVGEELIQEMDSISLDIDINNDSKLDEVCSICGTRAKCELIRCACGKI